MFALKWLLGFLSASVQGILATCSTNSMGFTLGEDYFANQPPSEKTDITFATFIFDVSKVDDLEQTFSVRFVSHYGWNETRIRFDQEGIFGKTRKSSKLKASFVEDCLWYPKFEVLFETALKASKKSYKISPNGMIYVKIKGEISISCDMNFTAYMLRKISTF